MCARADAIVWGPLGPITCCCPCVGHMGLADSQGRIHDFAGPYYIEVDDFMVGCVWRYAVVSSPADAGWDAALDRADSEYKGRMHDICCDNCHHHTALALRESGKPEYCPKTVPCAGLLSAWLFCCLHGRCTWWDCLYCSPATAPGKLKWYGPAPNRERL